MRIENNGYQNQYVRHTSESATGEGVRRSAQTSRTAEGDSLTLSARGRELLLAREKLQEMPSIREDLVRELRSQVAAGSYRPSSQQIARRMIAELGDILKG
jgi:flagellar biosynthesis anti-sigma factor FlgM